MNGLAVNTGLWKGDEQMEEKEMAGEYEIIQSAEVGSKRFVIGRCPKKQEQYMVANCRAKFDDLLMEYYDVGISADYMEIWDAYMQRQHDEMDAVRQQRTMRGSDGIPYTISDCVKGGLKQNLTGQVLVMNAATLKPELAVKEEQLFYAISGFGTEPDGRGTKIFGRDCYTGDKFYVRRYDVLGVLEPKKLPEWAANRVERFEDEIAAKGKRPAAKKPRGEER